MSASGKITPVLIEINGIKKRIINLSFDDEQSVYVYFPRKKGYKISVQTDIPTPILGEVKINMSKGEYTKGTPYLTFHPGKMNIHINTQIGEKYKTDMPILNMGEGTLIFPLCQILAPTFDNFDIYNVKKNHSPPLIMNKADNGQNPSLHIAIWIHKKGTFFELKDMPHNEIYRKQLKFIGKYTFQHSGINSYIATIILAEAPESKTENSQVSRTIVVVFNDVQSYAFGMEPTI